MAYDDRFFSKETAPALWGNPPLFDLAENLPQCREYHREQLCNWSKVRRSLGLTYGGQISEPRSCAKETGKWEGPFVKGFFRLLSFHLPWNWGSPFDPHRSNQVAYRLLTDYKVIGVQQNSSGPTKSCLLSCITILQNQKPEILFAHACQYLTVYVQHFKVIH